MTYAAARLVVRGRVQRVGFRWWTVRTARGLGLTGWVRNRADGSVEILAAGGARALAALEAACRDGPSAAVVMTVERHPAEDDGSASFDERPTL
ncbi:MAG TPA: acylphosphatase [Caulobacteraceae bacterium]|nr:acylphosphatase [Caulobacteraceae bacterium]